jgi:hypothetical protein
MRCTAPDDGLVRTHEDARALLTYAVPGARVDLRRPAPGTARESTRSYEITIRRHGAPSVCVVGGYSLPAIADRLASHARRQVEDAAHG